MSLTFVACQNDDPENPDVVPPTIVGTKNINYRIGDIAPNYLDGVSAYDNVDGNISNLITVDDSDVDLTQVGVYSLIYTVVDSSGNQATVTVSVTVMPSNQPIDTNIPVIIGFKHITHIFGHPAPDYLDGLIAYDEEDGNITHKIVVDDSKVDLETLGKYDLTYSVEDNARNSYQVTVEVTVVDLTPPVFFGLEPMTYIMGDDLPDFMEGVSAIDDYDGDITHLIQVDSTDFDDWFIGTYNIIYTVKDASDNLTTETRTIEVVDQTPPVILNANHLTYIIGDEYPDYLAGVSAFDLVDGILTQALQFDDSEVNYNEPGVYVFYIFVYDLSGNLGLFTGEIEVLDLADPVILGTSYFEYTIGDATPNFMEGVTATDNVDGDLTHALSLTHNVNFTIPGIYVITYSVTDSSDNTTFLEVNVIVRDVFNPNTTINQLNVFYLNDTHGAILENGDEMGMSKIGNLIMHEKVTNPHGTLFLSGGDMLQGSILSNYFNGASMIHILNTLEMDAFIIGNHEFDWGIEVVTNYRDIQNPLMYAEFPLLGANIFHKGTTTRPDYIDAYTIIQKGQLKVGIIGLMGYGLETSIATSRVSNYEFGNPIYWAEYYTEYLRTEEDVDMVLVVIHDDGQQKLNFNQTLSTWTGDKKVDAVFNGHSHQTFAGTYSRTGVNMPYIQSSGNGKRVGKVSFGVDGLGNITSASAINLSGSNEARLNKGLPLVQSIIDQYVDVIEPLLNEVIIYAGQSMSQSQLTFYMAQLIRLATDADIAFHNLGGTRDSIQNGEGLTVAKLYKIFPFDNRIKTVYLRGSDINQYISAFGGYNSIRPGINTFEANTWYKVATNDYVFDITSNPFIYGEDIVDTGILIRDLLETVLRNQADQGLTFNLSNPVQLTSVNQVDVMYVELKKDDYLHI